MSNRIYITVDEIDSVKCDMEEQETAINWLRDDDHIEIVSSDNTFITKMKRAMKRNPDIKCYYYENNRDKESGKLGNYFFEAPIKSITFKRNKKSRNLSDEQRKRIGERFKEGRKQSRKEKEIQN